MQAGSGLVSWVDRTPTADGGDDVDTMQAKTVIEAWPDESKEAAQLVIDKYGEPHELSDSQLIWYGVGPWKRMIATREFYRHDFPAPHIDAVESVLGYEVPPRLASPLAEFDGSVVVERTAGEVSARCHDEEANNLALNLMHDIVTGAKTVDEAREYYAKEFIDYRRKQPTPYMEKLRISSSDGTGDPDERVLSDEQLEQAKREGSEA
jgi:hypothetical protein